MNYETAKVLKDAGFPQDPDSPQVHTAICGNFDNPDPDCRSENRGRLVSLEELIEAVTQHQNRGMFLLAFEKNTWSAQLNDYSRLFVEDCATPAEAVAELWLALNKKQQSG